MKKTETPEKTMNHPTHERMKKKRSEQASMTGEPACRIHY